jgi:hypothetical protein
MIVLAVLVGGLLSLIGTAMGYAGAYILIRGFPSSTRRVSEHDHAHSTSRPARDEYDHIAGVSSAYGMSMEAADPPAPGDWVSDIGPPIGGSGDAELIAEWEEIQRALRDENDESMFPTWIGSV